MYQIIGISKCLGLFALFAGAISIALIYANSPVTLSNYWSIISISTTLASFVILVIGQTPLFPIVCRLPLVKHFIPDLDGEWISQIDSNWAHIQARGTQEATAQTSTPISARITIIARLFFIRINFEASSKYSSSKTIFVKVSKDNEDQAIRLNYIYENTSLTPESTDSSRHEGAACLDLKTETNGEKILEGVYWTNRNWHNALNTAGKIVLRRK